MKKWQRVLAFCSCLLFIGINLFLIQKDNSKIGRSQYVKKWTTASKDDIVHSLTASGVWKSSEETYFYFDDRSGAFQQFFVKKGDSVEADTPLFKYTAHNIELEKEKLETEKNELQGKVYSLEAHIGKLEAYKSSVERGSSGNRDDEEASIFETAHRIEQEIYNKELEAEFLQKEIGRIQQQMDSLSTNLSDLTVLSQSDGIVKDIRHDLQNPILTIMSPTLSVYGTLSEKEVQQVEEGMKAYISQSSGKVVGTISSVQAFPVDEPDADEESKYPFQIMLEGDDDRDTISGTHTKVEIVTKEALDAVIAPQKSIRKEKDIQFVWLLKANGRVEKRVLVTGLKNNGKVEIQNGLEPGEKILLEPMGIHQDNSTFFTPLDFKHLRKADFDKTTKRQKVKYLLAGLF